MTWYVFGFKELKEKEEFQRATISMYEADTIGMALFKSSQFEKIFDLIAVEECTTREEAESKGKKLIYDKLFNRGSNSNL